LSTVPLIRQRVTFNVIGTLPLPEADEAVTVTFEEPAGVPVAGRRWLSCSEVAR